MRRFAAAAALAAVAILTPACSNAPGPKPIEPSRSAQKLEPMAPPADGGAGMPQGGAMNSEAPDQPLDEKVMELEFAVESVA